MRPGAVCLACGGALPEHEKGVPTVYCQASCKADVRKRPGSGSETKRAERSMMARVQVAPVAAVDDAPKFFDIKAVRELCHPGRRTPEISPKLYAARRQEPEAI